MTDLPPAQYLDKTARALNYRNWEDACSTSPISSPIRHSIIAHARALHENAQLRAEIAALRPRETLEQVARREAAASDTWHKDGTFIYVSGFLRAAEMAKAGELPDE